MPITIKKMARNTASVSFPWGEDTVNLIYYPSQMTEEALEKLDRGNFPDINEKLCEIIGSWDVLEEDGSMFPLDPEHMAQLPLKFRLTIVRELIRDIRPND